MLKALVRSLPGYIIFKEQDFGFLEDLEDLAIPSLETEKTVIK